MLLQQISRAEHAAYTRFSQMLVGEKYGTKKNVWKNERIKLPLICLSSLSFSLFYSSPLCRKTQNPTPSAAAVAEEGGCRGAPPAAGRHGILQVRRQAASAWCRSWIRPVSMARACCALYRQAGSNFSLLCSFLMAGYQHFWQAPIC